jgi:6-phosphogluconate dehydrogenase (decarboxylating)
MNLGMIGLGTMGSNMVRRLLRANHQGVVVDVHQRLQFQANVFLSGGQSGELASARLNAMRPVSSGNV